MDPGEKTRQRSQHALVPLTQECGHDVFANAIAPQVVAAVAARMRGAVEVDPVVVGASGHAIPADADALTTEAKGPLEAVEIDTTRGVEVDQCAIHVVLPIQAMKKVLDVVHRSWLAVALQRSAAPVLN